VKNQESGEMGPWTEVLVVKRLLKEGVSEDLQFVSLRDREQGKQVTQVTWICQCSHSSVF
jgi:hypothetical protein